MPGLMKREPRREAADIPGRFDRMLDEWMRMIPFRPVPFPHWWGVEDLIRVEEFREDGCWSSGQISPASTRKPMWS